MLQVKPSSQGKHAGEAFLPPFPAPSAPLVFVSREFNGTQWQLLLSSWFLMGTRGGSGGWVREMPPAVWLCLIFVNKLLSGRKSVASWCTAAWCQEPSALLLGLLPILSGNTLPPSRAPRNSHSFHLFSHYLTKLVSYFLECFEPTIKQSKTLTISFSFHSPLGPSDILKLEEIFLTLSCRCLHHHDCSSCVSLLFFSLGAVAAR